MIARVRVALLLAGLLYCVSEAQAGPSAHIYDELPKPAKKIQHVPPPQKKGETIVKEIIEVAKLPPAPKKAAPVCIVPALLGIPAVNNCRDLAVLGQVPGSGVLIQEDFLGCDLLDDLSCDDGSGQGLEVYRQKLVKQGGTPSGPIHQPAGLGPCLRAERMPDNTVRITSAFRGEIVCCRPVCRPTTTTTTTTPTTTTTTTTTSTTTTKTEEALLPLEAPRAPEQRVPTYTTTGAPTISYQRTGDNLQVARAAFAEMCVMPQFLNLPRVASCADLRDISMSTSYVYLTNSKAMDCRWVEDVGCGPEYPGLGAFLDAGIPDNVCLAVRQDVCSVSIVGPYPILSRHLKGACASHKGHGKQMMPVTVMMPVQGKKGHRRRLRAGEEDADGSEALSDDTAGSGVLPEDDAAETTLSNKPGTSSSAASRSLGKAGIPTKGKHSGGVSDTVVVCCRLQCFGGGYTAAEATMMSYSRTYSQQSAAGAAAQGSSQVLSQGGGGGRFQGGSGPSGSVPTLGNLNGGALPTTDS